VFIDGAVIKAGARLEKGKQTDWDDYPPEKVAFFMRTPTCCRKRAADVGASVSEVLAFLVGSQCPAPPARCPGRRPPDKYPKRLNAACARAIVDGDPSNRTVKGILAAGTESEPDDDTPDAPAHLHGPDALFGTGRAS
jgi:hypothetical protein